MANNRFNKLRSNSDFPLIGNVDVYQFDNGFDYQRYNSIQMQLQICTVPWDVGEAHVGQRTISGIGNVVWFETKEKRNAWFDAIPEDKCYRFSTKYKELHRDMTIDVPIPFDMCARHNYLRVTYNLFANEHSPIEYEGVDGLRDWFWFIREVEFIAPSTTRLHLLDDAFQTWMYDVNIAGMVLERGHAPMFAMRADKYLQSPIDNNQLLLTDDVNYGSASQVSHIDALALNAGDMYACIAMTASPAKGTGTKASGDWHVPTDSSYTVNGVPSVQVIAIKAGDLSTMLANMSANAPQLKQTIQGVFFASKDLLTVYEANSFTFMGVSAYYIDSNRVTLDLTKLDKGMFGYDGRYADIAKLYTSPYAHLEVTDEHGNVDVIKVEDTTGKLDVSAALSLAYPFITIDAHLMGVGKPRASVTFRNVTAKTFDIQGKWYETLKSWKVPTFAVVLDPAIEYDYSTHFDRAQRVVDYTTAYDNASASASTSKTNSDARAKTNQSNAKTMSAASKANADASADTSVSNTALQVGGNTTVISRSNEAALQDVSLTRQTNNAVNTWENDYTSSTTNNEVNAEYASAAIGAGGGIIGSTVQGLMNGGLPGAFGGLVSGAISGATTAANTAVAANLKQSQADLAIGLNSNKTRVANENATLRTYVQNQANEDNTDTTNEVATAATANSAATEKGNASRSQTAINTTADATYSTETAANQRDYNTAMENAGRSRSQAQSAITNDIKQAALRAPFIYGAFSNGDSATTKPIGLFCNVVTQPKAAIASAGDEFLRYGYMLDQQWDFDGNFNIGKHFTYWKLKDFWVHDLNVPDMYMDKLRFFLFGGVTVWRKPEEIGTVGIYDNY